MILVIRDDCTYKKEGNGDETFCFKASTRYESICPASGEGVSHSTSLIENSECDSYLQILKQSLPHWLTHWQALRRCYQKTQKDKTPKNQKTKAEIWPIHNAYIEKLERTVHKIEPYRIPSYILSYMLSIIYGSITLQIASYRIRCTEIN